MSIVSGPHRVLSNRTNTVIWKPNSDDEDMASITKSFTKISLREKEPVIDNIKYAQ